MDHRFSNIYYPKGNKFENVLNFLKRTISKYSNILNIK